MNCISNIAIVVSEPLQGFALLVYGDVNGEYSTLQIHSMRGDHKGGKTEIESRQ